MTLQAVGADEPGAALVAALAAGNVVPVAARSGGVGACGCGDGDDEKSETEKGTTHGELQREGAKRMIHLNGRSGEALHMPGFCDRIATFRDSSGHAAKH